MVEIDNYRVFGLSTVIFIKMLTDLLCIHIYNFFIKHISVHVYLFDFLYINSTGQRLKSNIW